MDREWSISELARLAGTTPRALRHYGAEGLLQPSRIAAGGRRWYDERGLLRLQRILLLRRLGIAVPNIAGLLDGTENEVDALRAHLTDLRADYAGAVRRIAAVEATITRLERGEPLMAEESLDGFAPGQHRDEVVRRWGEDAYAAGARWWREADRTDRDAFRDEQAAIAAGWAELDADGASPTAPAAQSLASRHLAWLDRVPGLPRDAQGRLAAEYVRGVAGLYVDDPRFAAVYGGERTASLVRDALAAAVARRDGESGSAG